MKLIELLLTKGPNAYQSFRKSLMQNQSYLADILDKTELKSTGTGPYANGNDGLLSN